MSKELRFDDKVVIVTGAGGGLGRQYALMFGSRGARVVVNDLGGGAHGGGKSSSAADKVVDEIRALGGDAVANYDSVENGASIVQTAVDNFGTVDIVINNAGILRDSSFLKMTMDDWDLIYRVHLKGSMSVTHAAWGIMREKGYGRIIMTTSAAGIYGNFGQANYSAAKLGLLGLAKTLAVEGGGKNVFVNTIAPIAASRLTETVLPPEILEGLKPEYVSPLVGWLCHESCEENGGLFEVGAGIVNKLRWQRTKGVGFRLSAPITIEDMASKWEQIGDFTDADYPTVVADSMVAAMDNINNPKLGGNQFLDLDKAKASKPVIIENSYDERDLSLYALGVGVGSEPLDSKELQYLYERGDTFYALPTYGVIPPLNGFMQMMMEGKELPGMGNVLDRVLHGEQYTEIKRPLPPHARLRHEAKLRTAYDKGKDAIGIIDVRSFDETGEELAYNEITFFLRGCGGWGGDRGPSADINVPPARVPDAIVEEKIGDNQGLIYRLSGDWNPLHIDPEFARNFGFERPILHGLCTYGYVGRHVVQSFLGNDPRRFKSIKVRFAKSVYPGDTLVTRMWKESETRILLETRVKERDEIVIKNAAVELYEQIPVAKAKPVAAGVATAAVAAPQPTGPTSADIFAAIGAYLATNPAEVAAANTVFQFTLKDPDMSWTVDAKVGKVIAGAADKPDVTLIISDEQFVGMCVGGEDAQKLFFAGKLKITGNMMAAQKLEFLKKVDPKLVEAEVAKRLANAPAAAAPVAAAAPQPTGPTSADIFTAIGAYLAANPAEVTAANTVFQFNLKDPDMSWTVDAKVGKVIAGAADKPDVTLTISDEQFVGMCIGGEDAQKLFFAGKLKIAGNMMAASKLEFLKKMDPKLVEAEVAKRLAGGASAPAAAAAAPKAAAKAGRAEAVFAKLGALLAQSPELVKAAKGQVITFKVAEPDSAWTLDYSKAKPVLQAGASEGAALLFADEDLDALIAGTDSLQSLFQHGRVRVLGDMALIHTLEAFRKLA
jgi:3-hydroxyacyl-CoA dehydrogenase/3a,7a,12a-trihydroxy-5b-cholest-24-enoyl-CoA hydratase